MPDQKEKLPTLKTIADLTGLSLSTVSLSLRDGSKLKKATREKVEKAAKQVGYVPNRAGVRLRTGRTNVLALILAADKNTVDFTRQLVHGIGAQIHGTGFHLNVIPEFEKSDPVDAVRYVMENRAADGIILTHTSARDPRVQYLMDAGIPFVSHGRTEFYTPHAYHDFHAERYVSMAVERLAGKGRKRILLASVDNKDTNYSIIVNEFTRAVGRQKLWGDVVRDTEALGVPADARAFGRELGRESGRYDAIICNNELTALALLSGLSDENAVSGRDFDLVCKQTTGILQILYPDIDTIAEDLSAAGRELAKLLIDRISGIAAQELQTLQEPVPQWRSP